jgi:hypothetical protein
LIPKQRGRGSAKRLPTVLLELTNSSILLIVYLPQLQHQRADIILANHDASFNDLNIKLGEQPRRFYGIADRWSTISELG